jgi:hypothetical protein
MTALANDRNATLQRSILLGAAVIALAAVGTAALLWAHYGTVVFFEMIAAGIAYCF